MRFENLKINKFYFIGIGGISMSALAKLLIKFGYEVSGSDLHQNTQTDELFSLGVKVYLGGDPTRKELLGCDVVVYTDAVPSTDLELQKAREMDKIIYSRAELLSQLAQDFYCTIAVAGSHGKTTCTAMCAHILHASKKAFTAHIGGEDLVFSNLAYFGKDYLVTEACEYKKNLLKLTPSIAVVLNSDKDHLECYKDEKDLKDTFLVFANRAKTSVFCADNPSIKIPDTAITFGIENLSADYVATDLSSADEKYTFSVYEYGEFLCRVKLSIVGRCNVYNALAAVAVMRSIGLSSKEIANGLSAFRGVKRRYEKVGEYRGASVICDYAHHPREIAATIRTAQATKKGTCYFIFQPHTYSRTRLLFDDFRACFIGVENLMLFKTYAAREEYDESGSALTLSKSIQNCLYAESLREVRTWLDKTVKKGDRVYFLGAGDIYILARFLATQEFFEKKS